MKCQNCNSTDIVSISGSNFCINCGEQVKQIKEVASPKLDSPKVGAKVAAKPPQKKKNPTVVNPPKKLAIEDKPEHRDERLKSDLAKAPSAKAAPVTRVVAYETKAAPKSQDAAALTDKPSDLLRPYPKPTPWDGHENKPASKNKIGSVQPATVSVDKKSTSDSEPRLNANPLGFSLKLGLIMGALVGLTVGIPLWFQIDTDLMIFGVGLVLIATIALLSLAQAALLYGLSRMQDGRPAERKLWWRAGRGAFLEVANTNMIALITCIICVLAGLGVWRLVQQLPADPAYYRAAAGLAGYGAVVWVFFGAIAARHIALPAVVIGGLTSVAGTRLGWRAFTTAGGHLILALIETALIRISIALLISVLVIWGSGYTDEISTYQLTILFGVASALGIVVWYWLVLQIETKIWLKHYRYWVHLYFKDDRLRLLSGRVQSHKARAH